MSNFDELLGMAQVVDGGDDILFDFGSGNTLRLEDTQLSMLSESDFIFG